MSDFLQLEVLTQALLLASTKNKDSLEKLHCNLAWAKNMGVKRILLRLTTSPFQQLGLSESREINILEEVWPYLEPFNFDILVESWKYKVIKYALFKGARGFYDLNGLNNYGMLELAIQQECVVILPFNCPFKMVCLVDYQPKKQLDILLKHTVHKAHSLYKMGLKQLFLDPFGLGLRKSKHNFKRILQLCRNIDVFQDQGLSIFAPIHQSLSDAQKHSFLTLALENKADCIQAPNLVEFNDILKEY